jgi:Transposase domain (DUF772)
LNHEEVELGILGQARRHDRHPLDRSEGLDLNPGLNAGQHPAASAAADRTIRNLKESGSLCATAVGISTDIAEKTAMIAAVTIPLWLSEMDTFGITKKAMESSFFLLRNCALSALSYLLNVSSILSVMAEKYCQPRTLRPTRCCHTRRTNPFQYFFLKITFYTLSGRFQPLFRLKSQQHRGRKDAVRSGVWGRPSYPPLAMLKALLLQRWYSVSDEGLEEALPNLL